MDRREFSEKSELSRPLVTLHRSGQAPPIRIARCVVTNNPTSSSWQRDLRTIFNAGTLAALNDVQLLERIVALRGVDGDGATEVESAFSLLIERHGPMV